MICFTHTEIGFHISLKDPTKNIYTSVIRGCLRIQMGEKNWGYSKLKLRFKLKGEEPKKETHVH